MNKLYHKQKNDCTVKQTVFNIEKTLLTKKLIKNQIKDTTDKVMKISFLYTKFILFAVEFFYIKKGTLLTNKLIYRLAKKFSGRTACITYLQLTNFVLNLYLLQQQILNIKLSKKNINFKQLRNKSLLTKQNIPHRQFKQ